MTLTTLIGVSLFFNILEDVDAAFCIGAGATTGAIGVSDFDPKLTLFLFEGSRTGGFSCTES